MALLKRKPSFQSYSQHRILTLTFPLPVEIERAAQTLLETAARSSTNNSASLVAQPERKRKKEDITEAEEEHLDEITEAEERKMSLPDNWGEIHGQYDWENLEEISEAEVRKTSLADIWREIHGQYDWAGMLDPINPHLRSELIRYGEMAQACYDAFDKDPYSKYCGSCKFKPRDFFRSLGYEKENHGYEVSRYIYATYNNKLPNFFKKSLHIDGWSPAANWIGFIAVSDDQTSAYLGRRDIAIAWRGTVTKLEWIADLMNILKPVSHHGIPSNNSSVQVEAGFLRLYTDKKRTCPFAKYSAREIVMAELKRLKEKYRNEELSITITGHSLGSALAILSAYDIAESGLGVTKDRRAIPISVFSFSGPRVGNIRFKERLEGLGVKVLRVVNVNDKVPLAPGIFFNEHAPEALQAIGKLTPWSYYHVGHELALDHKLSPYLKETRDLGCFHNLEAHLHLLDGYHGKGSRFWLASGRDYALVNKAANFLKDEYMVPPNWSQSQNRGLERNHLGRWVVPERDDLDDHLPPEDIEHYLCKLGLLRLDYKQSQSSILTHRSI